MLRTENAVAAILRLEDGRYVMQLRDERPDIWYPGYWSCFGGAVDAGESPEQALARELYEEIELRPRNAQRVAQFDFGLEPLRLQSCYRIYFLVALTQADFEDLVLHEGSAVEAFDYDHLMTKLRLTPYDAFAIRLLRLSESAR